MTNSCDIVSIIAYGFVRFKLSLSRNQGEMQQLFGERTYFNRFTNAAQNYFSWKNCI